MNKLFSFLAFLLPLFTFAQQSEGEIIFTETVQLKIDLDGENEEIRKMMPTSQSFSRNLLFNENASVYKDYEQATDNSDLEINHESDGMNFKMVMKRPENVFFTDFENGTTINYREFFGRYFLVNGQLKKLAWKMSGEQKKVLGFVCQKAVFQDTSRTVEAWFTPQIPVAAGPGEWGGLPGMILEVSIDGSARTMVASKVELKALPKDAIEKPTKGKAVTQEEFDKIEQEKMKEMQEEMGGSGGGMKIIIKN
jgi:GLPGLI family protein